MFLEHTHADVIDAFGIDLAGMAQLEAPHGGAAHARPDVPQWARAPYKCVALTLPAQMSTPCIA